MTTACKTRVRAFWSDAPDDQRGAVDRRDQEAVHDAAVDVVDTPIPPHPVEKSAVITTTPGTR